MKIYKHKNCWKLKKRKFRRVTSKYCKSTRIFWHEWKGIKSKGSRGKSLEWTVTVYCFHVPYNLVSHVVWPRCVPYSIQQQLNNAGKKFLSIFKNLSFKLHHSNSFVWKTWNSWTMRQLYELSMLYNSHAITVDLRCAVTPSWHFQPILH